jgi:PDZ domain-containing protein
VSRRQLTLGLSGGLALLLVVLANLFSVPYIAVSPGPAFDTLGKDGKKDVLSISGAPTYRSTGTLSLTTVNVQDEISLVRALKGWISDREAVVPREFYYPPDQDRDETDKKNTADMIASQDDAAMAALGELGLATITVDSVAKDGGSAGKLQPGDVISTVDGTKVGGPTQLRTEVRKRQIGDDVSIGYVRKGKPGTATITTGPSQDKPAKPALGITTKLTSGIKVDISLENVGGPSAGLMFALGIIEKLGEESLTGGKKIAGTGTISADGTVGPIGGIAAKMLGAKDAGATVFLSPAGNCAEAKKTRPDGLTLVKAGTLHEAVLGLESVRLGRTAATC